GGRARDRQREKKPDPYRVGDDGPGVAGRPQPPQALDHDVQQPVQPTLAPGAAPQERLDQTTTEDGREWGPHAPRESGCTPGRPPGTPGSTSVGWRAAAPRAGVPPRSARPTA